MATEEKQIKVRRDTTANLANVVPAEGEPVYDKINKKLAIGDGATTFANSDKLAKDSEVLAARKLVNNLYDGVNLATKFANEISANHGGDAWAWIKARKNAANFEGINIDDYIPLTTNAGTVGTDTYAAQTFNMHIMGIDTYYQYGDQAVPHHIDFFANKHIGKKVVFNPSNNNNGSATCNYSWLQSNAYAYLNGVDNSATAQNGNALGGNYEEGGFIDLLPDNVKNIIIEKRQYIPKRYSASGILTENNAGGWENIGKLWLPTEQEVYGCPIHSAALSKASDGLDFGNIGSPVQYPLFKGTAGNRNHKILNRVPWWLSSVPSASSARACSVNGNGNAFTNDCTNTWITLPLCFRI